MPWLRVDRYPAFAEPGRILHNQPRYRRQTRHWGQLTLAVLLEHQLALIAVVFVFTPPPVLSSLSFVLRHDVLLCGERGDADFGRVDGNGCGFAGRK
jgi:hypothetical protein